MTSELTKCELLASDLRLILRMFDVLESAAAMEGVTDVRIVFRGDGNKVMIGYGENAEPAVLAIESWGSDDDQ